MRFSFTNKKPVGVFALKSEKVTCDLINAFITLIYRFYVLSGYEREQKTLLKFKTMLGSCLVNYFIVKHIYTTIVQCFLNCYIHLQLSEKKNA